jgi:type IV pilus assembly protein PilY1
MVTLGYNNTAGDGKGHLFVLKAETEALIADIPTSAGTPSGLGQISAYAANGRIDATVDTVDGGDLLGNVWRFNLSGDLRPGVQSDSQL